MNVLVEQIVAFNHAWKSAIANFGNDSAISIMLRDRKSSLQSRLLRCFPDKTYLRPDESNVDGEALFSVRLVQPVTLKDGTVRQDAEHLPKRLAEELFTTAEIEELCRGK